MQKKSSSTRDQVLNMLKIQKHLTVSKIAEQLNITEMAVRRHLNTLQHNGLVQSSIVRQSMGRPLHVYDLTNKGDEQFPRNYQSFVLELMNDFEDLMGEEMLDELFEKRQHRTKEKIALRLMDKSFSEKVEELADFQNENGYMVQLIKESDKSYRFIEYNCPIFQVAMNYKKACNCELELFQEVLGTDEIERRSCLSSGGDFCDYRINMQTHRK